ncbi:hypothetical protein L195_g044924 [Trifolium pratense]|uniref:DUF674 family protein n=2 Tax=Trifolium pratense TaxID=57577 RepID=A0A2K3MDE9_TRIPR|nr:hypothetical protein L195_g044924 [Trifolium pratense]
MASSSSDSKLTLKLLIDTNNGKVLFAEASKPVVDFLFNMLYLPIATVVKILRKKRGMVCGFSNLHQSIEDLDEMYVHPQSSDRLFNPTIPIFSNLMSAILSTIDDNSTGVFDFLLNAELEKEDDDEDDEDYVEEEEEDDEDDEYDEDYNEFDDDEEDEEDEDKEEDEENEASDDDNILIKNGIVKEGVTYMVMDDLVIHPLFSAISMIELLNTKLNIKDINSLQEKVVELGVNEGIKLLEASMQSHSKMILTSVFINKED